MSYSPYVPIVILSSLCIILVAGNPAVINAIVYFLIAGVIPGTDYALSPNSMLGLMTVLFVVTLALVASQIASMIIRYRQSQRDLERAKRLPRRRYQQRTIA